MTGAPAHRQHRRPRCFRGSAGIVPVLGLIIGLLVAPAVATADPIEPVDPTDPASTVLVVHTDGDGAQVGDTATEAQSSTVDVRHTFPSTGTFSVAVPTSSVAAAVAKLRTTPGVRAVEPPATRTFSSIPNDPGLNHELAYLDDVHARQAWDVTTGSQNVRIAIVDSGVDVNHPDLKSKIVGTYNADNGGTSVTDSIGHGTFVAGVAAAATDNGVGISGAGYNTSLLAVKIANPEDELSIDDEIAGINWAVSQHADIINLSLGGPDPSAAEKAAIDRAMSKGVLVVAAAGNEGDSTPQYPAAYPGVISVGATDPSTNRRASFSSYGSWVTLAAPGVGDYSTTPRAGSDFFPSTSGYASGDGTSFSTPLVAGEAALLKAVNPTMTVNELRHALVASSSGLGGQGLGAGLVNFAQALRHVPPTSTPTSPSVVGTSDQVSLQATTTAPAVEFQVDSGTWSAPVPATSGLATMSFATWGLADGDHTLNVAACSAYGECGTGRATAGFTLANTAPVMVAPAADTTSTGRFVVQAAHPAGGGARLLVDGRATGFAASSPYTFTLNASALPDGAHTMQVVLCSVTGSTCAGPASPPQAITTAALHPRVTSLTHPAISPNGDGIGDTATLHFTLPDAESVQVETITSTGGVVLTAQLGSLAAGNYTWTWRGLRDNRTRLPDGRYTLAVVTTAVVGNQQIVGYAAAGGTVDTVAPRLTRPSGNGTLFYPVKDGYRDTFTPRTSMNGAGTLTLTIRTTSGRVVRTLTAVRPPGAAALTWNGHDSRYRRVPAGSYRWQYSVIDAAGNRSSSGVYRVVVSSKRLVTQVLYVRRNGATTIGSGGTDACSSARKGASHYRHGIDLVNGCRPGTGDFAYATYRFTVPGAIRYLRLTVQVYGRSLRRPSQLSAALERTDGGLEIPAPVAVRNVGSHWHSVASVPAAAHITSKRHAYATILLTGVYQGRNDFDVKYARLRVRCVRLS